MTEFADDSQFPAYTPSPVVAAARKANWTPEQIVRIDYEWRRLQRNFAYHPVVRVIPVEGEPPTQYEIEYRVRTLGYNEEGQLDYFPSCSVTLELPSAFPHAGPVVRPTSSLFHPNISQEAQQVAIIPDWTPGSTLEDVIFRVGTLLAFQSYDPNTVWNPVAMQWVIENGAYLPTDPSVNIEADNGGDPLERIRRSGPATLRQLREQLTDICNSMLDVGDPPTGADVRQFASGVRLASSLFQSSELPEELSKPAVELREWATQLPVVAPTFEALRATKANIHGAMSVQTELETSVAHLTAQLTALEKMVTAAPAVDAYETMRQIPKSADIQTALTVLRGLLAAAEQKLEIVKQWLPALVPATLARSLAPLLKCLIQVETTRQASTIAQSREKLLTSVVRSTNIIDRTRLEVAALEQLEQWKQFSELTEKAHALVMRIEGWGGAGVQAYFVTMGEEQYGPFEFEQQIELGTDPLVVRNPAQRTLDLLDATTGRRLVSSEHGGLKFDVPGEAEGESHPAAFQLTARCDDLWLQLEYVIRQTQSLLTAKLTQPVAAPSWMGTYSAALATAAAEIAAEHRSAIAHWTSLVVELKAIGAFKERTASYYLIKRLAEQTPVLVQQRGSASKTIKEATQRIAEIQARSAVEPTSGQLVIPARLHKEYAEKMDQQAKAQATIAMTEKLLRHIANQIRARTASRGVYGSARWPQLTVLSALPDELYHLSAEMSDELLGAMVTDLGAVLQIDLKAPERPASKTRTATTTPAVAPARPAAPATAPVPQPRPLAPLRPPEPVPVVHAQPTAAPLPPEKVEPELEVVVHDIEQPVVEHEPVTHAEEHAGEWQFVDDHAEGAEHHEEHESDDIFGDWPMDGKTPHLT